MEENIEITTLKEKSKGLNISVKSFITAIAVILGIMVVAYILTFILNGGQYSRDESGAIIKDSFATVSGGLPFWKWLLSPVLVLFAEGGGTIIAVLIFLLVIGGVFNSLHVCGVMQYMLDSLTNTFKDKKYLLMGGLIFFFMAMGALIGSFEEVVPLVPIVVALSISLGWDALTGISMSLLAAGCGFASGVFNPFTVGTAQKLAGLPMFSGAWLRLVAFALIYILLFVFVYFHSKRIEKPINDEITLTFEKNVKLNRGMIVFGAIVGVGILIILLSGFIPALQDYTMIIVAVMFLIAGVVATLISGMSVKDLGKSFLKGILSMLPAVIMIMMASSVKYTLVEGKILDTILHGAVDLAETMPTWVVVLFIYLLVLFMNFFVPSGSAKAFMLIPLICPLAEVFGIPAQLCIVAFAFGDGFSNVIYPTNPALLISLGLVNVSYGDWLKWSIKFQLCNLLLTSGLLLLGLAVGYC